MAKYKVELVRKEFFVIDVLADNEYIAKMKAEEKFVEVFNNGIEHYHVSRDPETEVQTIYDVTNTDDPFNP